MNDDLSVAYRESSLGTPTDYNTDITSDVIQYQKMNPPSIATVQNIRNSFATSSYGGVQSASEELYKMLNSKISIDGGFSSISETHDRLSDGSYTPKYSSYVKGVNNNNRLAQKQEDFDKFINPIIRFGTKVSRGAVLDIVGFANGVGQMVNEGKLESFYNNDFSKWVDDLDKRTDNAYTNYYTEAQSSLTNVPYLFDKVLGGAEFTARMLASESLIAIASGGTSLSSTIARQGARLAALSGDVAKASKLAKTAIQAATKVDDIVEVGNKANKIMKTVLAPVNSAAKSPKNIVQNVDDIVNTVMTTSNKSAKSIENLKSVRFAVTGSAYEAGFEARHFQKEAEDTFWEYYNSKGIEPTKEEIDSFYNKLDGQSNVVFGANMALLSISNLAMFGKMMNIKSPFGKVYDNIDSGIAKKLYGQGIKKSAEDGTYSAIKATLGQKALAYSSPVVKGIFTEGVFEEGGQGIASSTMQNYVASAYDKEAMRHTANYMNSFNKAFSDQFSTKEGLEEIIVGGIIGGLFGGFGGISSTKNNYAKQGTIAEVYNYAEKNKGLLYTDENLASLFSNAVRTRNLSDKFDKLVDNNEMTETAITQAEMLISTLEAATAVGKDGYLVDTLLDSLDGASNQEIADNLGIDINSVEDFKKTQREGFEAVVNTYATSKKFADNIFGGSINGEKSKDRANMASGLAYAMTMGKVSEMTSENLFESLRDSIASYFKDSSVMEGLNTFDILSRVTKTEVENLQNLENTLVELQNKSKELAKALSQGSNDPHLNVNTQNTIQKELEVLNKEISDTTDKLNLAKESILGNFHKTRTEKAYNKMDLDNFQSKLEKLNEAVENISDKKGTMEIVLKMQEFNKANAYYKQFHEIANSLIDPQLQYKTYNHIFSRVRTKNKNINEFTKDFFKSLQEAKNIRTQFGSPLLNTLKGEIDNFTEDSVPSNLVRRYVADKKALGKELTEQEQLIDSYENRIEAVIERQKERERLQKRKDEILSKLRVKSQDDIDAEEENKSTLDEKQELEEHYQEYIELINEEIDYLKNNLKGKNSTEDVSFLLKEIANLERSKIKLNAKLIQLGKELKNIDVENAEKKKRRENLKKPKISNKGTIGENLNTPLLLDGIQVTLSLEGKDVIISDGVTSENIGELEYIKDHKLKSLGIASSSEIEYNNDGTVTIGNHKFKKINGTSDVIINSDGSKSVKLVSDKTGIKSTLTGPLADELAYLILSENLEIANPNFKNRTKKEVVSDISNIKKDIKVVENQLSKLIDNKTNILSRNERIEKANSEEFEKENKISELELLKETIKAEYLSDLVNIENKLSSYTPFNKYADLTDQEFAELKRIQNELKENKPSILEYETRINNNKNEVLTIIGNNKTNSENIDSIDEYYNSEVVLESELSAEEYEKVMELLNEIRYYKNAIKELSYPKLDGSLSMSEQIRFMLENNPIFSNEQSPYYATSESEITMNNDEMNRLETLKNSSDLTEEELEELNNLQSKAERVIVKNNLVYDGVKLNELMLVKDGMEAMEKHANITSYEVNSDIFYDAIQNIEQGNSEASISEKATLIYDSVVSSDANIQDTAVTKLHNIKLENLLSRFFLANPNATLRASINNGTDINELGEVNKLNYIDFSIRNDNKSGLIVEFPNGESLVRSVSENETTGAAIGYSGNIEDFGLQSFQIRGQKSQYNLVYERNSQGGFSQVKSDFEVTINGIPLSFNTESINAVKVGDTVELKYMEDADYSKDVKGDVDKAVIVIMKDGEYIGILKASSDKFEDLRKVRQTVIDNGTATITISHKYLGLPNMELTNNNEIIAHDASKYTEIGYKKPNETAVLEKGDIKDVDMNYVNAIEGKGTIPFVVINYHGSKIAFPIVVETKSENLSDKIDEILNSSEIDGRKALSLNEMLAEYRMFTNETQFNSQNLYDDAHIESVKQATSNVSKIVNVTDFDSIKNAERKIMVDPNNPFNASKFKLDFNSINKKPKNKVATQQVKPAVANQGEEQANNNNC